MSEPLRKYCDLKGGTGFPELFQGKQEGNLPFIKVSDMSLPDNKRYITVANNYVDATIAADLNANVFPPKSTVFAKVGAALLLNRRRMLTEPTIIDNNMMAAVPTDTDPEFLYHFLCSIDFAKYVQTGALPSVNQSTIGGIPFPEYSLSCQHRITEILSTLDETIEQTEALIAKYQQIKAGLMHDLFTRGVTPDGKLRPTRAEAPQLYKESSLGWIPKEWEVITAGQTCQLITKGTTPALFLEKEESWSVPYIRVQNLSFDGSLAFEEDRAFIPAVVSRGELARSRVLPNDILMNIVGPPLGKVSVVPNEYPEWNVNQAIAIFRTKVRESTYYLSFYLLSNIAQSWFLSRAKRTSGQVNLTLEMCRDLPISFPLKSNEQITITEGLANADDQIRSETLILKKLRQQKHGLMHDLLTGHVRVKVAESEPAQM